MESVHINILAVLIAVVANFIFGYICYTPLFGKAWANEMGFDPSQKPKSSEVTKGYGISPYSETKYSTLSLN